MRSMTGFGRGVAEHAGTRATVDVRAVNHRFLDIKLRGAPVAPPIEDAITARIRGALERGAITVGVHVAGQAAPAARIDLAAARASHAALAELARELGIAGPDLALVLAQSVVTGGDDPRGEDGVAIVAAVEAALVELAQMREVEGAALARELASRLDELTRLRRTIEQLAAQLPELTRRRLQDRLRRLLRDESAEANGSAGPDPARLAQEVALLADRADISEELVRLASHLDQARALVAGSGASGRRLDFLVQEIGRELNTIGSKSALTEISTAVVEAKTVLEKVREQIQNVE